MARKVGNTKTPKKTPSARAAGVPPRARSASGAAKPLGKYKAIRQDLLRQRAALLAEAGAVLTNRQDHVTWADLTDQAQAEVDRNFVLRLKEREQKLLKKIDMAVERIDNGTFGVCRGCGNEIPLPRLQARPVADLCIECKTRQEQDEKIRATG